MSSNVKPKRWSVPLRATIKPYVLEGLFKHGLFVHAENSDEAAKRAGEILVVLENEGLIRGAYLAPGVPLQVKAGEGVSHSDLRRALLKLDGETGPHGGDPNQTVLIQAEIGGGS